MENEQKRLACDKARKLINLGTVNVFGRDCGSSQENTMNAVDVLKCVPRIKGWITRDRNNSLYFHLHKPRKTCYDTWEVSAFPSREQLNPMWKLRLPGGMDVPCKWEDDEPMEVELLINVLK